MEFFNFRLKADDTCTALVQQSCHLMISKRKTRKFIVRDEIQRQLVSYLPVWITSTKPNWKGLPYLFVTGEFFIAYMEIERRRL